MLKKIVSLSTSENELFTVKNQCKAVRPINTSDFYLTSNI